MSSGPTADQALEIASLRFGARTHVVERAVRRSFADLHRAADRRAQGLARLPRGGRVALEVTNSFDGLAAAFAIWRAGGVLVPLNPKLASPEKAQICELADVAARGTISADGGELSIEVREPRSGTADPELAAIAFTSGTTGVPKGVEITHANLLWAAAAVVHTRRDRSDSVAAVVSPLCHLPIFVSHYLARLLSGGTVVIGAFEAGRLAAALGEEGITDLQLVPAKIEPLLGESGISAPRLRKVTVGSTLTPMETKARLRDRFPEAEIIEAYGQTESTDGLTMTVGLEALERPGTVGRAHSIVALAVRAPDGSFVPAGEPGEIVCRGPVVMRGYFRNPEATAAALRDGWLHTGDLGRMDEDGYVYITGRLKEIIISGGENISPEEVEAALASHPAVAEVAVFGLPDPRWGELVAAAVVARSPATAEMLTEHVGERLARFKRPRKIWFVDSLPKTAAGKVKRQELRKILS